MTAAGSKQQQRAGQLQLGPSSSRAAAGQAKVGWWVFHSPGPVGCREVWGHWAAVTGVACMCFSSLVRQESLSCGELE